MSSEEKIKEKEIQKNQQNNESNEINNNDSNNLFLDLYDEDTLNISLEEEKPLFTKLYSNLNEKINSVKNENMKENENEENNEFLTDFENLFKNQIDTINLCVKNNQQNFIYATNVLVAKYKIFNFFNMKYLDDYLSQTDAESSNVLNLIIKNMNESVNKMVDIIYKLGEKSNKINNQIIELQNRNNVNEIYIKQVEDENNLINEKFNKLKNENELITQKLINNNLYQNNKINSDIKSININMNKNTSKLKSKNKNANNNASTPNNIKENNANDDINNNINNNYNNTTDKKQNLNIININKIKDPNRPNHSNIHNNVSLTNLSIAGNRVFTLKMMKEVISNIYTAKAAFDKKCLLNKQAKQTMEEFMYTYLNQKYGLKNMVIEWATNIINGIRTFSPEDTEISLFGKILQNELEENCKLLISNLKESINSIIINILRNEYPYKSDLELNNMKKRYIKKEIPPEKTQQIIESLFDDKGKEILFDKINKEINNRIDIIMKNNKTSGKMTREEYNKILYDKKNECNYIHYDFLFDICLEYQIKLHIKYLKPFVKLFQSIDINRNGILDEEQFSTLIHEMKIFGENNIDQIIYEFLNNIDPYQNKHITFSDIVEFFSKINFDQNQTIMDKYCIKDNNINGNNKNDKKVIEKLNEEVIA